MLHPHPCCGCSYVLHLLLSSASDTKARSPLENSVPCLANRTLDDDPRVRRTPSVGWLSKSMTGERARMAAVAGHGRAGSLGWWSLSGGNRQNAWKDKAYTLLNLTITDLFLPLPHCTVIMQSLEWSAILNSSWEPCKAAEQVSNGVVRPGADSIFSMEHCWEPGFLQRILRKILEMTSLKVVWKHSSAGWKEKLTKLMA